MEVLFIQLLGLTQPILQLLPFIPVLQERFRGKLKQLLVRVLPLPPVHISVLVNRFKFFAWFFIPFWYRHFCLGVEVQELPELVTLLNDVDPRQVPQVLLQSFSLLLYKRRLLVLEVVVDVHRLMEDETR